MAKKKKKSGLQLVILLLVLLALIAVYVIYSKYGQKNTDEAMKEDDDLFLWTMEDSDLEAIDLRNESGEFHLIPNSDGTWSMKNQPEIPLNATYIDKMLSYARRLRVMQLVKENVDDLSQFGLDEPVLTLTVTKKDGGKETALVGLQSAVSSDYYACKEGSKDVYYISSAFMTAFGYNQLELTDAGTPPTINIANITNFLLEDEKNGNLEIVYDPENPYDCSDSGVAPYYLKQGYEEPEPGNRTQITYYLDNCKALTYKKCVAYDCKDASVYGMNDARKITISYYEEIPKDANDPNSEVIKTDHQYRLWVGSYSEEDEAYYVMDPDTNNIFLMEKDMVEKIVVYDLFNLTSVYIQLFNVKTVDSVEYTFNGETHVFSIEHRTEKKEDGTEEVNEYFKLDGEEKDDPICRKYYRACISPLNDAVIPEGYDDSDKPVVAKFKIVRSNGSSGNLVTEYREFDDSFYTVAVNGRERFLVDRRNIDVVNNALYNLINNINVDDEQGADN